MHATHVNRQFNITDVDVSIEEIECMRWELRCFGHNLMSLESNKKITIDACTKFKRSLLVLWSIRKSSTHYGDWTRINELPILLQK